MDVWSIYVTYHPNRGSKDIFFPNLNTGEALDEQIVDYLKSLARRLDNDGAVDR